MHRGIVKQVMHLLRKVVSGLTLVSAGLAAIIFPITLFAIQGMSRISFEVVALILSFYLFHPMSLVLIFLVRFEKIAPGRRTRMATGFVAFNAFCLLALAALIRAGVFGGDAGLPLIFAIPSFLFLLNSFMGVIEELSPGRQLRR